MFNQSFELFITQQEELHRRAAAHRLVRSLETPRRKAGNRTVNHCPQMGSAGKDQVAVVRMSR